MAYLTNKLCARYAKSIVARKIGMFAYEENYWRELVKATYKLFLESYFDLVMCVMLNTFAFFKMSDGW